MSVVALDDPDRLVALHRAGVLDGDGIPGLDRILRIAQHALDAPMVTFSAVGADRQVFVDKIGLPAAWADAGETPLSHSYCRLVVVDDAPLVVTDAATDARVRDNPATTEGGIGAYLGVPVRSPDGHTLGALCVLEHDPRAWSDREIATLGDLAASVEAELRLRESTQELGDQLTSESLERGFEESMTALAAATSRSWTVGAVVRAIVDNGTAATGATVLTLAVHEDDTLRYFDTQTYLAEGVERWITTDIAVPSPMAEAARADQTVIIPDATALSAWPTFAEALVSRRVESFVAVPVGNTDSGVKAVIGIGWNRPIVDRALPRSVSRLAVLARQGFDRAHSHQAARDHAALLESLVLPDTLPRVPGLDLAGIYLPPTAGQRVGGDLYDAVVRDDGRVALVVADAAGHDIIGSLVTSRVRTAFTMLSLDLRGPAAILDDVNRFLLRSSLTTYVTAVVAVIDVDAGTITIANAGHPQPRRRHADGTVDVIGPSGQPLLGLQPVDYEEETVSFAPGESVVLFTDGLIERRDRPFAVGETLLEHEFGSAGDARAAATVDRLASLLPVRDDDLALLIARRVGAGTAMPGLDLRWAADRLELRDARARISDWLDGHDRLDDALLVATELLTNARTASAPRNADVTLRARCGDEGITLSISNAGPPLPSADRTMPDLDQARGRGLAIASALADTVVHNGDGRVTVTAHLAERGRPQEARAGF